MSEKPTLDYLAAKTAQEIASVIGVRVKNDKKVEANDLETLATKALGVLQSQGVYALALFLFSRSGKETDPSQMKSEERVATQLLSWLWFLRNPIQALSSLQKKNKKFEPDKSYEEINNNKKEMLEAFAELSQDLDTLLLVRDLYEQTLIYARYHAKALGG